MKPNCTDNINLSYAVGWNRVMSFSDTDRMSPAPLGLSPPLYAPQPAFKCQTRIWILLPWLQAHLNLSDFWTQIFMCVCLCVCMILCLYLFSARISVSLSGYIEAVVIPAGARRIKVVEDKPSHSFLGNNACVCWISLRSLRRITANYQICSHTVQYRAAYFVFYTP